MGRVVVHWLLVVSVGLGLSWLGAYWVAEHNGAGLISWAILAAEAFSLAHPRSWLLIAALLLWQNRTKIRPWFSRGRGWFAVLTSF